MSYKRSAEQYNKAFDLYKEIRENWGIIESGEATYSKYMINDTLKKVKQLKNALNKIHMGELEEKLPKERYEKIEHNILLFDEAAEYIEENLIGIYYADKLRPAVDDYIEELKLTSSDIQKWGGSFEYVVKNFIATITDRKRVKDYENEIKRMMKGKMSQKEFGKIFDVLKNKMTKQKKRKPKYEGPKTREAIPPGMWSKEKKEEFYKKSKGRWPSESEREEKAEQLGVNLDPPKREFKKDDQYYIETPNGKIAPFKTEVKTKSGIVTYIDDEGNEVYSYLSEGFFPLSTYVKIINS